MIKLVAQLLSRWTTFCSMEYHHTRFYFKEVLAVLQPQEGQRFIDATLGNWRGYTMALAKAVGPTGLIEFDLDPLAIQAVREKLSHENIQNVLLINDNFANLTEALKETRAGRSI